MSLKHLSCLPGSLQSRPDHNTGFLHSNICGQSTHQKEKQIFFNKNTINIKTNNQRNNKLFPHKNSLGNKLLGCLPVLVKFLPRGSFEQGTTILLLFKAFPMENTSLGLVTVANSARGKVRPRMVNNSFHT